ncbi:hypothetical protein N7454_001655 [Penicillium verhagenii]|nr:hypothetical protein N7454_001655 [Penicillium verhagenii]
MSKQNTQIPAQVQPQAQGFENCLIAVEVPVMVHLDLPVQHGDRGSSSSAIEYEPVIVSFYTRMYYTAQVDMQQMQQAQQEGQLQQL